MNPSQFIDQQIASTPDWRGDIFKQLREIILSADPGIEEGWKWDTAVWLHHGLLCAGCAFKTAVKLNFFQGASLPDPYKLFNAGLDAKKTRAIDFHQGEEINKVAVKELIQAAITYNLKNGK